MKLKAGYFRFPGDPLLGYARVLTSHGMLTLQVAEPITAGMQKN